ncbi:MAG: hypothetical protein GX466_08875 [Candidatus Cloacimonetes bacterium]|nr:hypothetical protein [Candidatus Cloacimonadota bacterium]
MSERKPAGYWDDDANVLAEGRKYASRKEFYRGNSQAYKVACRRNLLDQLYPSLRADWSDNANVLAEGRKYVSRAEFKRESATAYGVARQRKLLDQLYPSKNALRADWSDDANVLAEGRKYSSRKEFYRGNNGAYDAARKRNLLDQLYPSLRADWSDDASVLAEGCKYVSRAEFKRESGSAYQVAWQRNLLDLIDWPEENAPSDNDAIYIWRAVGEYFNGHPVYKIGVTSARLGTARIEKVGRAAGFEVDLICCEPVQCKATDLEAKLHILGENPGYTGFDGCTEFRALSPASLDSAITIIRQSV